MRSAIVAGANGFIGQHLVRELAVRGVSVLALDRCISDDLTSLAPSVQFDLDNVADLAHRWSANVGEFDVFFNLAWQGSAGPGRGDARLQLANAQWSIDLLTFARDIGCKRYVGAGSIMEYETLAETRLPGARPALPHIYSDGKLAAHLMGKTVAAAIGIDFLWAEITNVYGPGERSPRFINSTLRKMIEGRPLEFTSATQMYDFVYITDAAEAFYRIGESGQPFCEYLIGSGSAKPLRAFIEEMAGIFAPEVPLHFGGLPFTGVSLPAAIYSTERTERDTGFRATTTFEDGLRATMRWLKEAADDNTVQRPEH